MKLVHMEHTFQLEFEECKVQRLIIEEASLFSSVVFELKQQIDGTAGKWVLSERGELLKFPENAELIINPFDLDINQKKLLLRLYGSLEQEINDSELLLEWRSASAKIEQILEIAIENIGFDVTQEEIELKSLFKTANVRFRERGENHMEALIEYMELVAQVRQINLFILVNATTFFTEEELKFIYEQSFYKKYYLLMIDANDREIQDEVEKKTIIDKDYCIICPDMK